MYNLQQDQHFLGHTARTHVQIYLPLSFLVTSGNFERYQVLMSVDENSSLLACYAMTACDKYFEVSRSSDFRNSLG
jgi:hypothetical protein